MKIEHYMTSSIEERLDEKFLEKMEMGLTPLKTMQEVFIEVALENIIATGNQDDLVDDFAFLLDHFEEMSDLILIEKVKMYNDYISSMIEYFNICYLETKKRIISICIPSSNEFNFEDTGDTIIFTHGYSASTSGKEAAIALFKYIDDNFIQKKNKEIRR